VQERGGEREGGPRAMEEEEEEEEERAEGVRLNAKDLKSRGGGERGRGAR